MPILGIDVSHHQGMIDRPKLGVAGKAFVIIKACQSFADKRFRANWHGAAAEGLVRGAYHYFAPSSNLAAIEKQASTYLNEVKAVSPIDEDGTLPPVLDIEDAPDGVSLADYVAGIRRWIEIVEGDARFTGRRTILYTSRSFWDGTLKSPGGFADQTLWVADYSKKPPRLPTSWTACHLHQYSATGTVSGISGPVDLNEFAVDAELFVDLPSKPS